MSIEPPSAPAPSLAAISPMEFVASNSMLPDGAVSCAESSETPPPMKDIFFPVAPASALPVAVIVAGCAVRKPNALTGADVSTSFAGVFTSKRPGPLSVT